jgi:hypothetical protein
LTFATIIATFAAKLIAVPAVLGLSALVAIVCALCLAEEHRASKARDVVASAWAPLRVAVWVSGIAAAGAASSYAWSLL